MKKYNVIWKEWHETSVWADDEEKAIEKAQEDTNVASRKGTSVEDIEIVENEEGPDPMYLAKMQAEEDM